MKFTISKKKPFFKSYNNSEMFIKFLGKRNFSFLNFNEKKKSFLIYTTNNRYGLDAYTPIHFQNYIDNTYLKKNLVNLKNFFRKENYISFYIQTKNNLKLDYKNIDLNRYRTNYFIDLKISKKNYYLSLNQLSRRLLKKVNENKFFLKKTDISEDFIYNYNLLAKNKKFSKNYIYTNQKWKLLNKIEFIKYYQLIDSENNFIFGGVFGIDDRSVDYLYGCGSHKYKGDSRVFFKLIFNEFKKLGFKRIYLGGGVYENDSLSQFKKSIGGKSYKCSTIRCITDEKKAAILNSNNKKFFSGFFPPYNKK